MVENIGKVIKISGDKVFIEVEEGAVSVYMLQEEELEAGGKPILEAFNTVGANVRDRVRIRIQTPIYMKIIDSFPALLCMIGILFGIYLAERLDKYSLTLGTFFGVWGLLIGVLLVLLYRKRRAKKIYVPVIVEILKTDVHT
jgi:hypothetical protein